MTEANDTAPKEPNWIEKVTLLVGVLSLIVTTILGGLAYRLDSRLKTVETELNEANTKIAQFQAKGNIEYKYFVADIKNFCGSKPNIDEFQPSHVNLLNLYDGFVQNEIFDEAEKIINDGCKWLYDPRNPDELSAADRNLHDQAIPKLENWLAYIEVSNTSSFNSRVEVQTKIMPPSNDSFIWEYADKDGEQEIIQLGLVTKEKSVLIPLALLKDKKPQTSKVIVPTHILWLSPIIGDKIKLPIDFILSGRYWRSIQMGWQRSGA